MSQLDEECDLLLQVDDALDVLTDHIVLDSVCRFSGLERNIVFGINPGVTQQAGVYNLLLCLASRAKRHLYILKASV